MVMGTDELDMDGVPDLEFVFILDLVGERLHLMATTVDRLSRIFFGLILDLQPETVYPERKQTHPLTKSCPVKYLLSQYLIGQAPTYL